MKKTILLSLKTILLSLMLCTSLFANEDIKVQSMTVTAQKVEEKLINVPISMSVLTDTDIEDKGVHKFEDLGNLSPNFTIIDGGGGGTMSASARGVVGEAVVEGTNVAIFVDGVPYLGTVGNEIAIEDIERIEILKGPQGSLYGQNAYAGVVNIITKEPTNETKAKFGVRLGNNKLRELKATASGAIIEDKLFIGVTVKHSENGGFIENPILGKKDDYTEFNFGKIHLRAKPIENLNISLISSLLSKEDGNGRISLDHARLSFRNMQDKTKIRPFSNSLKIEYGINDYTFSSLTTYKDFYRSILIDGDFTEKDFLVFETEDDVKDLSQELRFLAKKESFNFLGGLHFQKSQADRHIMVNEAESSDYKKENESYSAFANLDLLIFNPLTVTFGARFDDVTLRLNDRIAKEYHKDSENAFSPKVSLKYKFNENFMGYATVSKGYKSGGYFPFTSKYNKKFDSESLINYEIGSKLELDKLSLSGTIFYMDISDKQVVTRIKPGVGYITNATTAISKGFELEAKYNVSRNLSIFANFGYADSKLEDFKDFAGDYSGNKMPFAPKFTYSIGSTYRSNNGFFATLSFNGQDDMYSDKENESLANAYTIANTKIGYERENFDIYFYCNNIADKEHDYILSKTYVTLSKPRDLGIEANYRF